MRPRSPRSFFLFPRGTFGIRRGVIGRLVDDVKTAARQLTRRPFLTGAAGLCLALGVGVNTAVYSVVEAALLRPLPFAHAERLVLVGATNEERDTRLGGVSPDSFEFLQVETTRIFAGLVATTNADFDLSGGDEAPERWSGSRVTPGFFELLGVEMISGNGFEPAADPRQAVISDRLWKARFGGSPEALGSEIRLDGVAHRIVGIVPRRSRFPAQAEIWVPLDLDRYTGVGRTNGFLNVVGRARPDIPEDSVAAEVVRLGEVFAERTPGWISDGFSANDLRAPQVVDVRPVLTILMISALVVLAMACLNAMSLFLVQVERESRAAALRSALGATSRHLALQSTLRFGLLALLSGLAGTLVAIPAIRALVSLSTIDLPGFSVDVDLRVFGFALVACVVATVLAGLMPTLATARAGAVRLLGNRGGTASAQGKRLQGIVVVAQVTFSVVLTAGAWVMAGYVVRLETESPGFTVDDVFTARIGAPLNRFPDLRTRSGFVNQVLDGLRAVPGVLSAGATSAVPIGDPVVTWSFSIEDRPPEHAADLHAAYGRMTAPGYLETLEIPLLEGRPILPSDTEESEPVVLINRSFQETYWPGESALGKRIKRRTYDSAFPWLRIVGVVEDVREFDLGDPFQPTIYFVHAQHLTPAGETVTVVVRSRPGGENLEAAVRGVVAELDGDAAVFRVLTMRERIVESTGERRLGAILLGSFGVLGLVLSLVGVYGVIAETVARRRRELGIRMALGASPGEIRASVIRQASTLALAGIALGASTLYAAAPRAEALLPGLQPDVWGAAGIVAMLFVTTLAAAVGPALRAGRSDVRDILAAD